MTPPLVSILIPCHNAGPWLADTLDSALSQTWPRTEIIVVDDGSTDDSLAIARGFEARDVRVIAQANRGASAARNAALAASTGSWLQFLDADDLLAEDKLAQQLRLACRCGDDSVLSATWSRFTRTPDDADFTPQPLFMDAAPADWMVAKFERNAMMHPAAWLVPRAVAEKAGPWDESLSLDDDGEYFARVLFASKGVRYCRESTSFYRSGIPGSLSGAKSERAWDSAFRSLEMTAGRLRKVEDTPRTRHACATAFQRYIYEAYPRSASCRQRAEAQVAALGGSDLKPEGGPRFQMARRLLGWRLARRLQPHS